MDKSIEETLRQHLIDEAEHNAEFRNAAAENAEAIRGLIHDLRIIKSEQQVIKQTVGPVHDFFVTMESVGRVGRIVRACVGWLVLVIGTLSLAYVAVSGKAGE